MDQISDLEMRDKNFLELGCGAGMISILAAKKGAKVTASDISKLAIKNCRNNAENNNVKILVTESDLFANIHQNEFDYIIINPPYYPKEPKNIAEKAWYCGVNFEYFTRLFSQLKNIKYQNAILILSEDCNINRIKEIATQNFVELLLIRQQRHYIETNFVYKLIT
jgi:release factor glutamine methyltransferase